MSSLAIHDLSLAEVADIVGGTLDGPDTEIRHLRPASSSELPSAALGYAAGRFVADLVARDFAGAIMRREERDLAPALPVIIHPRPASAFFVLHRHLVEAGRYPTLDTRRGTSVRIAKSAVVHEGTQIGNDVVIGDHVTILPNTVLEDGVRIQSGTVVGEPGFQVAEGPEGRFLVPHAGGVHLGRGVSIGANCCVDRAIFSTYTTLATESMLDNLVHVAHDVTIGRRCTLTAHAELSGSVTLDDDVWLAPRTSTNQFVRFGRGSFTGTGSVVVRDVAAFQLVKGNPARPSGFMCLCKSKLPTLEGLVTCEGCGRQYRLTDDAVELIEPVSLAG